MRIGDLLSESLIIRDLQGKGKFEAIENLLDLLVAQQKIGDRDICFRDLVERENYLSTGLENGLAIPHAKTTAVNELLASFGLSVEGLDFGTLDGKPAHFIFLLLSPTDTSGPHIKILAQITRNFRDAEIRKKLIQTRDKAEILQIIQSFK